MNYSTEIAKKINTFCLSNGFQHIDYFEKLLDDVLYDFGKPVRKDHLPNKKTGDFISNLSGLYAEAVIKSEPFTDIMGNVYMNLAGRYKQKGLGQFFTPEPVCDMMTQMSVTDEIFVSEKEYLEVSEPCVGAGGMILSFLKHVNKIAPNLMNKLSITCNDLDYICCKMASVQIMSNLLIYNQSLASLIVWQGNTLGDPKDWNLFFGLQTEEYSKYRKEKEKMDRLNNIKPLPDKVFQSPSQLSLF